MSPNILLIFFGVIAVLFVIVLVIMYIGFMRSGGGSRRVAGGQDALKVEADREPVAHELGQYPARKVDDRRGEDVGGNFSRVSRGSDTSSETRGNTGR